MGRHPCWSWSSVQWGLKSKNRVEKTLARSEALAPGTTEGILSARVHRVMPHNCYGLSCVSTAPKFLCEALTPDVTVCGDTADRQVIPVKKGIRGGP